MFGTGSSAGLLSKELSRGDIVAGQEGAEVVSTLVAARESSRDSTGGIPRAAALNTPRWSSSPSAMTMQFSAVQQGSSHERCSLCR